MYLIACGVLLATGLFVNRSDRRMLALTALVGVSIFIPVPRETAEQFYLFCAAAELTVAFSAYALRARAAGAIVDLCVLLVIVHAMGYAMDGSPPFSPYRGIVKLLEIMQLVSCIALSPVLAPILRNKDATPTT